MQFVVSPTLNIIYTAISCSRFRRGRCGHRFNACELYSRTGRRVVQTTCSLSYRNKLWKFVSQFVQP